MHRLDLSEQRSGFALRHADYYRSSSGGPAERDLYTFRVRRPPAPPPPPPARAAAAARPPAAARAAPPTAARARAQGVRLLLTSRGVGKKVSFNAIMLQVRARRRGWGRDPGRGAAGGASWVGGQVPGTRDRPLLRAPAATRAQLSSMIALLWLASFAADFLMLFVLPERKHYRTYKLERTPDFSDLRNKIAEARTPTDAAAPHPHRVLHPHLPPAGGGREEEAARAEEPLRRQAGRCVRVSAGEERCD